MHCLNVHNAKMNHSRRHQPCGPWQAVHHLHPVVIVVLSRDQHVLALHRPVNEIVHSPVLFVRVVLVDAHPMSSQHDLLSYLRFFLDLCLNAQHHNPALELGILAFSVVWAATSKLLTLIV